MVVVTTGRPVRFSDGYIRWTDEDKAYVWKGRRTTQSDTDLTLQVGNSTVRLRLNKIISIEEDDDGK